MKLEIKHILPYVEHGLETDKGLIIGMNKPGKSWEIQIRNSDGYDIYDLYEIKPKLKPLSELPSNRWYSRVIWELRNKTISHKEFEKLVSERYDIYGLIDNGLAIDINEVKG